MKYCSVIVCHYAKADDFGETKAANCTRTRFDMMKETITSLHENTDYPAELIVIDNGGNPDDTDWLLDKVRKGWINTLIRNKKNMNFAYAWNQGLRLATGDYLCFTCNDLSFKSKWLSPCIQNLERFPERKLIASPIVTPDKDKPKYWRTGGEGYRINSMAGSNCIITTHATIREIGEFPHYPVGGTIWHRKMAKLGYQVILPPENRAEHLAHRGGVNFSHPIPTDGKLMAGEKVDFQYSWNEPPRHYFYGKQKPAGIQLTKEL